MLFPDNNFYNVLNFERSKSDWRFGFVIQSSYITIGWRLVSRGIHGKSEILFCCAILQLSCVIDQDLKYCWDVIELV